MSESQVPSEAGSPVQIGWLRRRLVRLLLTTALVMTLLCSGGAWWWSSRPDFADAVREAGGRYRFEVMSPPLGQLSDWINNRPTQVFHWIEFAPGDVDDEWLHAHREQITKLKYVILFLRDTRVTGDGLSTLSAMQNLHYLDLTGTQLEDSDISHILTLPVAQLYVGRTGISDSALGRLSQMTALSVVGIDSTQATPQGIAGLATCPGLNTLMLIDANDESVAQVAQLNGLFGLTLVGNDVTAASLPALTPMQGLQVLMFYDSDLSDAEIDDLRQALPGCTVQQQPFEVLEQLRESLWE